MIENEISFYRKQLDNLCKKHSCIYEMKSILVHDSNYISQLEIKGKNINDLLFSYTSINNLEESALKCFKMAINYIHDAGMHELIEMKKRDSESMVKKHDKYNDITFNILRELVKLKDL